MSKAKSFILEDYTETVPLPRLTHAMRQFMEEFRPDVEKIFHEACVAKDHNSNEDRPLAHLCLTFDVFPPCSTRIQTPYPVEGPIFSELEAGQKMWAFIEYFSEKFGLPSLKAFSDIVRDYENPYRTRLRIIVPSVHVDMFLDGMGIDPYEDWSKEA